MASTTPLDHTTLPALPLSTPAENFALSNPGESQPKHCDEREWSLRLPPPITPYSEYKCSRISYYTRHRLDGDLVECTYSGRKRCEVLQALKTHRHLRSLLEANVALLEKYGEKRLAVAASSNELRAFAQNHCALHETLDCVERDGYEYGLPGREAYRLGRNYFSHTFLTPKKSVEGVEREVKGTEDLYSRFLEQVIATEGFLREGLNDHGRWAEVKENWNAAEESREVQDWSTVWVVKVDEDDEGLDLGDEECLAPPTSPQQEGDRPAQEEEESSQLPDPAPQGLCVRCFKTVYYRSSFVRCVADTIGKAILSVHLEYHETDWNSV
jgi:hypothetical protein